MVNVDAQATIKRAIEIVEEMSPQQTDGEWLEIVTVEAGPHIREWDLDQCYLWAEWPERETRFPGTTKRDVGIDAVGIRRSEGEHIAIQCKARKLDEHGRGNPIAKTETDKLVSTSSGSFWAERWIVTNGDSPVTDNTLQAVSMTDKPLKLVNIASDLLYQQATFNTEDCPHCQPNPYGEPRRQTRSCMQDEAVAESIRLLREHEQSDSGGLPVGQARGKVILPCGTGKTRISLRIVEELTPPGDLSIVLCPSIALVAQIRREYLQHATASIRALAVCSDETAGYDPKKESVKDTASDPTLDNSNVSASELKGRVTTDAQEIGDWIRQGQNTDAVSVIFGTYQSGHRISEALHLCGAKAQVLIADEAHRTAGLRRKRTAKAAQLSDEERRIRDFTLCHDNDAFPATYRVYQTATPRIYDTTKVNRDLPTDWIVRSMDDESIFGVELYRKSYVEAVRNNWLADYRIIALAVNDPEAYAMANELASATQSKGRLPLTSSHYLRGLAFALAMGGATQSEDMGDVLVKSCIAFMNTVDKSQNMARDLQHQKVKDWVQKWLHDNANGRPIADYSLEHLDATYNVMARDNAKRQLAEADEQNPHGIINVGIFGEGTDSPSLSAVAFLEPRKSPIDVIQAVGRAMRTAPNKKIGYIICPILIDPEADAERHLSVSNMEEGWQELGQILLALRAHDQRIEDNLADLLHLYVPKPPPVQRTIIAVATNEDKRIQYREHEGAPGEAQEAVERYLAGQTTLGREFRPITEPPPAAPSAPASPDSPTQEEGGDGGETQPSSGQSDGGELFLYPPVTSMSRTGPRETPRPVEPSQIIAGKKNADGSTELRMDSIARGKVAPDGTPGAVDIPKSKAKGKDMINKGTGIRLTPTERKPRRTREEIAEQSAMRMLRLSGLEEHGNAIKMNLLSKSGLSDNRIMRDLNILENAVKEASFHLRTDEMVGPLNRHFGLDNLKDDTLKKQADGCTIAALLMMNAAMLHQRISNGRWLSGISDLSAIKNDVNVVRTVSREWERIIRYDFRTVLEPARDAIYAIDETGKLGGLERALRHIAAEAERIAETYADMGADHAGPLFNRVMGNQASDGAFFTRPVAASIAARLTLDACEDADWSDTQMWRDYKTVDLACGSGTLLAAMLTEMKRRARERGANNDRLVELQKLAVEEVLKGLDINPVSLQLAASQLTAGNHEIRYRQMGLHLIPYGPSQHDPKRVSVGTLELLGQKDIVPRANELGLADDAIASQSVWDESEDAELEDAVEAVKNAKIIIMNPPFTERVRMGEKFPKAIQESLRKRTDDLERKLVRTDAELEGFVSRRAVRPLFVTLAERAIPQDSGILTMVNPTIMFSATSGLQERRVLAKRFHIHTVLTSHHPGQINLSQNTSINESIVVAKRHEGLKPPTRFISLDKMPTNDDEVTDFHQSLIGCTNGPISNGWGEVCEWPAERMEAGNWTPAIWRSSALAEAAASYASPQDGLRPLSELSNVSVNLASPNLIGNFQAAEAKAPGSFPLLKSRGAEGQLTISSTPDEHWLPKERNESVRLANGGTYPLSDKALTQAGYLLVTDGQRNSTARVTATASDDKYVGVGWMPVTGLSPNEAKAIAVFFNSTAGRLQIMSNASRTLQFPMYRPAAIGLVHIPDIKDGRICHVLADCWERTKDMEVPQFRDGECEVRRLWDEAVAEAMGWDAEELTRLRLLLHQEPHVRGLGYNQYADELEDQDDDEFEDDQGIDAVTLLAEARAEREAELG